LRPYSSILSVEGHVIDGLRPLHLRIFVDENWLDDVMLQAMYCIYHIEASNGCRKFVLIDRKSGVLMTKFTWFAGS